MVGGDSVYFTITTHDEEGNTLRKYWTQEIYLKSNGTKTIEIKNLRSRQPWKSYKNNDIKTIFKNEKINSISFSIVWLHSWLRLLVKLAALFGKSSDIATRINYKFAQITQR
ncbi:MAG: hypothetical protein GY830_11365 [Bacteroidetes bacterium]|nr:hypothetical protein [Bacteroidota bacterium]